MGQRLLLKPSGDGGLRHARRRRQLLLVVSTRYLLAADALKRTELEVAPDREAFVLADGVP
jgi:hypothetical protein